MVTTRFATPNRTETKTAVNWRTNETHSIRSSVEFIGTGTREEAADSSEKSSEDTRTHTYHIVDVTDQHVGKSLIITGAEPPEKQPITAEPEGAPRKSIAATEKPPEK